MMFRFFHACVLCLIMMFGNVLGGQVDITIPGDPSGFPTGGAVTALPNGNFVVVESDFSVPGLANNAGAVRLFSVNGVLISTLTGSTQDDEVGSGGVKVLANGNFLVLSPKWDNGGAVDAGAVTWCSAVTGVEGGVSAANSLVGSSTDDWVGEERPLSENYPVVVLDDGNYVVNTPYWNNGNLHNAGAVTWGDGNAGVSGMISAANALVGSTEGDFVGSGGVTVLTNGHYVVASPDCDGGISVDSAGAVTWGDKGTGVKGPVSPSNSLVGRYASDQVGRQFNDRDAVVPLSNGDYVVCSPAAGNTESTHQYNPGFCGAVTWCSGATGRTGEISSANSLMGYWADSNVGSGGVKELANGAVVVISERWYNGGMTTQLGAVTWCPNPAAMTGFVSVANSLVGSTQSDRIGFDGVTALTNGNYVVSSTYWDNGSAVDAGAATWGSGAAGVVGVVSSSNSLVGGSEQDRVGDGVVALSNGNAAVWSWIWDNGAVENAGAVTWMDGNTGLTGLVNAANSLVGGTDEDRVGQQVVALSNGNYAVLSSYWDNGGAVDAGAVTWCDGSMGRAGAVTTGNSFHGVGQASVTALRGNGNYLVRNFQWSDNKGFVAWGSGNGGLTGGVGAGNALVGQTKDDMVGFDLVMLSNGHYVVVSSQWANPNGSGGLVLNAGAVTWGNGVSGVKGAVSAANSLVGMKEGDFVGGGTNGVSGVYELKDGNYLVLSTLWDNPDDTTPPTSNAGAATWCNGNAGRTGTITQGNSLVGNGTVGLGYWKRRFLPDGGYLLSSYGVDATVFNNKKEVRSTSLALPMGQTVGVMSAANTVVDRIPQNQVFATTYHSFDYDAGRQRLLVGRYGVRKVTLLQPDLPKPVVTVSTTSLPALASSLIIKGRNFTPLAADNSVTFNNGATGVVTAATPTQLTVTELSGLKTGPLTAVVTVRGVSSGKAVQVAVVAPEVIENTAALGAGATSLVIQGGGFSTTPSKNLVTLGNGAKATVTAATPTTLTVTVNGLSRGPLTALVKVNGISSGAAVQVATVVPQVLPRTAHAGIGDSTLMIFGAGFSSTLADNVVSFDGGVTGVVTAATSSSLTVGSLSGLSEGPLTVEVTTAGLSSGAPVQVATVIPAASGAIRFSAASYVVMQGAVSVELTLERTGGTEATGVTLQTDDGTASALPYFKEALAGADYVDLAGPAATVDFAPGENARTVTLTLIPKAGAKIPNKRFTATLSDPVAGAVLGDITQTAIEILAADSTKPSVVVTSPSANANVAEGADVNLTGSSSDGKGVAKVQMSLNGGSFNDLAITSAGGLKVAFALPLMPVPGINQLTVRSIDMRGNLSAVAARAFNYNVIRPLTVDLTPSGAGTVPSKLALANYKVGFRYTLEAKPAAGKVFAGWMVSDASAAGVTPAMMEVPKLTFTHQENLVLTASFIDNPFTLDVAGVFNGLAKPDNQFPDRAPAGAGPEDGTPGSNETAGFLTAAVTTKGALSGKLKIGGLEFRLKAVLDNSGNARFGANRDTSVTFPRRDKPSLVLALQMDLSGATNQMVGTLTQHEAGEVIAVSQVLTERAHFNSATKLSADLNGEAVSGRRFTLMFQHRSFQPGYTENDFPQGDGFATGVVSSAGQVRFSGRLADDTPVTFAMPLSRSLRWPLFAQLYAKKGSLSGWVDVQNAEDFDMSGAGMAWYRPSLNAQWYPLGWADGICLDALAAIYEDGSSPLLSSLSAPDPLNGNVRVTFSGGNLGGAVTRAVNIDTNNKITVAPLGDKSFTCRLVRGRGDLSGFVIPTGGSKLNWRGVLFQKGSGRGGYGYFVTPKPRVVDGTGLTGSVLFLPQ